MNKHRRILLALFFYCFILSSMQGQTDLQQEFDRYVRQETEQFDRTLRRMNKEFALYLRQEWKRFDTFTREPLLKDPDVPTIKQTETIPSPTHAKLEEHTVPLPDVTIPDKHPIPSTPDTRKEISFYDRPLSIPFRSAYPLRLAGTGERAISNAWNQAADINYTPLLNALREYKEQLRLNDWGFLLLVRQSVQAIYGKEKGNDVVFLTAYLLNQSEESVRIGRVNGRLVLLLQIKELVYALPQFTTEGQTFTIYSEEAFPASFQVYTYTQSFPRATRRLSLHLPLLPDIGKDLLVHNLPNHWQDTTVRIEVNRALIHFMATMPQTDFRVYLESGTSAQIEQLVSQLKAYTAGLEVTEAVALLLDFVQNTFAYQSDTQQFGYEKVFFPDEMLYYPYNDCEDRAILFCRLVSRLLRLKVALVSYPNHIAAAVCFPSPIEAETSYLSGGERYTLCDPTYINARIGECMPQFAGKKPELIKQSYY